MNQSTKQTEFNMWLRYCKYLHFLSLRYGSSLEGATEEEKLRVEYLYNTWKCALGRLRND